MDSSICRSKFYAQQNEANFFPQEICTEQQTLKEMSLLCAQNLQNSTVFLEKLEGQQKKKTTYLPKNAAKKHFLNIFAKKKQ